MNFPNQVHYFLFCISKQNSKIAKSLELGEWFCYKQYLERTEKLFWDVVVCQSWNLKTWKINWWMVWLFVHSFLFHSNVIETSSIRRLKNKSFHCLLVCVLICTKSFKIIVLFSLLFVVEEIFILDLRGLWKPKWITAF